MEKIKNIMFICTGNICRSAMAEGLLKKMLKDKGITNVEVCSAGIYAETGSYASDEAIEVMKDYDVDLIPHRATNIRESNIKNMDLILCATMSHKMNIKVAYPELASKIYTIKEYAYGEDTLDKDISDPWGYSEVVYRKCAKEIEDALNKIVEKI